MKGMQHVDTVVATIAGNILTGRAAPQNSVVFGDGDEFSLNNRDRDACAWAVAMARCIMQEVDVQEQVALEVERSKTGA